MFKNYFRIGIRNLWKNKAFSGINILGLSIGMASAILILLWIRNELSYDRFHDQQSQLYKAWNRLESDGKLQCWDVTPKILGPTLQQEYPEIREIARVNPDDGILVTAGEKKLTTSGYFTDPGFLTMFSFPLLKGNAKTALEGTYSIVITETLAKKLFGTGDPMGKIIALSHSGDMNNATVTGILKDLPNNTQFKFEYLLPWEFMKKLGWDDNNWGNNSVYTFVALHPNSTQATTEARIQNITKTHSKGTVKIDVFLHPLSKARLYQKFENGKNTGGRIGLVRLFGVIAAFILLIACINFMNLSTARNEKRAKEVGIRKVMGAQKGSLIGQFLGESILIALLGGIVAMVIVQLSLPAFNKLTDKQLFVAYNNPYFWLTAILFVLFTGVMAGSYPAFYLSSFQPIRVLKGSFRKVQALVTPRKLLVITQFTFAIVLIICTIIVQQQIQHAQDRDAGYTRKNVGYVFLTRDLEKNYELLKNELIGSGAVVSMSKTSAPLTQGWSNTWDFKWRGKTPGSRDIVNLFCSDGDLVKTAGFTLVQGRDINLKEFPGDSTACLVNESAVKLMGFTNPLGQLIENDNTNWVVVGVIKDFILQSPYRPMAPMVIEGPKAWFNVVHLKLNDQNSTSENLKKAEQVFKKYNPAFPFEYNFIDEEYAKKFNDEKRIGTLAGLFAGLTIFISCLGLFGLATYMAENRIKEIGVRKVLGASVISITTLLSKDFLQLVLISLCIASPVAWWAMHSWLQDFPYRVSIQWWVFALAGMGAVLIALLTVSYKSIRAALANPVKSLRTE